MNKVFAALIVMLGLTVSIVADEIRNERIVIPFGTNGQALVTVTNANINGFVEEVTVDVPLTTVTSSVSVVAVPIAGSNVELATNTAASADWVARPRVKTTSPGGAVTSTDTKYLLLTDKIVVSVTNTTGTTLATNCNFVVNIKTSRSGGQ